MIEGPTEELIEEPSKFNLAIILIFELNNVLSSINALG